MIRSAGVGLHGAEQPVQRVPVHLPGAGHQPGRVGQVPGAALVHDDLRARVHRGDVAGAARVVQVDVRHHHRGQVGRAEAERGQRVADHRRRRGGARLHQARPVAADQVAGRDARVAGHPGIDLVHIMPKIGNPRGLRSALGRVHATMVPDSAGGRGDAPGAGRMPAGPGGRPDAAAVALRLRVVSERGRIVPWFEMADTGRGMISVACGLPFLTRPPAQVPGLSGERCGATNL